MSIALQAHGPFALGSAPNTLTLPSGYQTSTGDCIVVVVANTTPQAGSVSGCGATWVLNQVTSTGVMLLTVATGYGCTSGGTSIVITGFGSGWSCVLGVFSGVMSSGDPRRNVVSVGSFTATPSLTYVAGDLLVGAAGDSNGESITAATWSNGGTNNSVALANGAPFNFRTTFESFQLSAAGSSTTYQVTAGGATNTPATIAMALRPAPPPTDYIPEPPSFVPHVTASAWFRRAQWRRRLDGFLLPSDAEQRLVLAR